MCGIAGIINISGEKVNPSEIDGMLSKIKHRGPDDEGRFFKDNAGFGHVRLSIIDLSAAGHQPMFSNDERFMIVFNGEIYNYLELRKELESSYQFKSKTDTEVLLAAYIKWGENCLHKLNGDFAFVIYDTIEKTVFGARDRFGIKPFYYHSTSEKFVFASEIKAILPLLKEVRPNDKSIFEYLSYNRCDQSQETFFDSIFKLLHGHCFTLINGKLNIKRWYHLESSLRYPTPLTAEAYREELRKTVKLRLRSDVPIGVCLSGGIDSSIITACAAKHVTDLNTYSIGFKDEPYFDETYYANLVAKKFKTQHTVFSISNDEMFSNIFDILDYIDEPFADSSAIAVYILTKKTRERVTVSLSGDGGDELFAGYNKHKAELRARNNSLLNGILSAGLPVFKMLPKSRHSKVGNLFRQLERYSEGLRLSKSERYWRWCTFNTQDYALSLLRGNCITDSADIESRKKFVLDAVTENGELNDILFADTQMVLPNDMLTKVDLMSMANSLEVRVPLLDYTVVDFAFSLPVSYKIDSSVGKKILKDAFRSELPDELFTRPKHGFEVPLLKWMKTGLNSLINEELLSEKFIEQQGIFETVQIQKLKQKLFSSDPGDAHATVWGLLVFQYWYRKYIA